MTNRDLSNYITSMLGGTKVRVELDEEDLNEVVQKVIDTIRPYYDGVRYVQASGKVVDLSAHNPTSIINVYRTNSANLFNLKEWVLGGPGLIIYDINFRDSYISYLSYKMLFREFNYEINPSWKYIRPILYLDGYTDSVVIEMRVGIQTLTDIERDSRWFPWAKDYGLALAKIIVGRKRSKYTVEGSPYELDGAQLISEGNAEKEALESRLSGSFRVV